MNLIGVRIVITLVATFTAIVFIFLSYLFPRDSVFILTVEVILLPTIYIVGNYFAEFLMESEKKKVLGYMFNEVNNLGEKYNKERSLRLRAENKLRGLMDNGEAKK